MQSPIDGPRQLAGYLAQRGMAVEQTGFVLVDHGSRRAASNALLLEVVELFREQTGLAIVEPAHMELAEPSVATAYGRCVDRGATWIVVYPYFLLPGRHWHQDIPRLAASAAANHPSTQFVVPAPLGLHPLMAHVIADRIAACVSNAIGDDASCDTGEDHNCPVCPPDGACRFRSSHSS